MEVHTRNCSYCGAKRCPDGHLQVVAKILAKALMSIPSTDFLLCTYLISEQIKVDASVEALYQLSNLLEQADFKEFWKTYTNCAASPLLAAIPDFEEKVGDFVVGLLTASHQSLDKAVVATLLNKTLGECEQLILAKGWEHDEHTVSFPLTAANQVRCVPHCACHTRHLTHARPSVCPRLSRASLRYAHCCHRRNWQRQQGKASSSHSSRLCFLLCHRNTLFVLRACQCLVNGRTRLTKHHATNSESRRNAAEANVLIIDLYLDLLVVQFLCLLLL